MKTCPACAEEISSKVDKCPYCGSSVKGKGSRKRSSGGGGGKSTATIVMFVVAGVFAFLLVCGGILAALLLPAVQQAREAARRAQCMNNLKQIGLALHNYREMNGAFPPAYIADANGKPMHSWRVLILPYLDASPLYAQYNLSEPWDGPNNSRLLAQMPAVYACPSHGNAPGNTTTAYAGVFGEQSIFRGAQPVGMSDITDGTSNTIMVGEASESNIPWMKPEDVDVSKHPSVGDPAGFNSRHTGGIMVLMCDGSVRYVPLSVNPQTLKALFTRNGGEPIMDF